MYLKDSEYGKLSIIYESNAETWFVHAEIKKARKTKFVLETPNGENKTFKIDIRRDTYNITEKK